MKKLLHERLRECSRKEHVLELIEFPDDGLWKDFAERFADEIERYYIPRPRFEDGEPVQDSDIDEIGGMATCCVFTDGSWLFNHDEHEDEKNSKGWVGQSGTKTDRIKRPSKVLDVDGVEIKKGDTVWSKDGEKFEVEEIKPGKLPVKLTQNGKFISWNTGKHLSHKEPDSIQKVIDYLNDCGNSDPSGLYYIAADRLSAIIEKEK